MSRIHWVARGTGTSKDRDEVNKREVSVMGLNRDRFFFSLLPLDYAKTSDHVIFRDSPAIRCLENRACIFSSTPQAACAHI